MQKLRSESHPCVLAILGFLLLSLNAVAAPNGEISFEDINGDGKAIKLSLAKTSIEAEGEITTANGWSQAGATLFAKIGGDDQVLHFKAATITADVTNPNKFTWEATVALIPEGDYKLWALLAVTKAGATEYFNSPIESITVPPNNIVEPDGGTINWGMNQPINNGQGTVTGSGVWSLANGWDIVETTEEPGTFTMLCLKPGGGQAIYDLSGDYTENPNTWSASASGPAQTYTSIATIALENDMTGDDQIRSTKFK